MRPSFPPKGGEGCRLTSGERAPATMSSQFSAQNTWPRRAGGIPASPASRPSPASRSGDRAAEDRQREGARVFGGEDRVDGDEQAPQLGLEARSQGQRGTVLAERGDRLRIRVVRVFPNGNPALKTSCSHSFLPSRVASLALRSRPETATFSPKPERVASSEEAVASFSWEPPALALRGECLEVVFSCGALIGTWRWPALKRSAPSCSTNPFAAGGSNLPPLTGKETTTPWSLAGATALSLTPFAFSRARRDLSSVSLVAPEATGS
jgi:hypothetical protein